MAGAVGTAGDPVAVGMIVGHVEGWSIGDASYFISSPDSPVGYGDLVPGKQSRAYLRC